MTLFRFLARIRQLPVAGHVVPRPVDQVPEVVTVTGAVWLPFDKIIVPLDTTATQSQRWRANTAQKRPRENLRRSGSQHVSSVERITGPAQVLIFTLQSLKNGVFQRV